MSQDLKIFQRKKLTQPVKDKRNIKETVLSDRKLITDIT